MNSRKFFFWFHLIIGCSTAVFIFLMSITGVALTYERQIIQSAQRSDYPVIPSENAIRLPLDDIIEIAKPYQGEKTLSISFANEINAPFVIKAGRKTLAYINPFTGDILSEPASETKLLLAKLRAFHRWLTLDGKFSDTGRWVNGIANVCFLLLTLSGLYLWLPAKFKKRAFKQKLTLSKSHQSSHARDYQWHNTFGFYMAPLLIVITATAMFFSFKWPSETLKSLVSLEQQTQPKAQILSAAEQPLQLSMQALYSKVASTSTNWQSISFSIAKQPQHLQKFYVDMGNGGEPQKKSALIINTINANVIALQTFEDNSTYRKVRSYIRFLHTGEVFGVVGQTIAGLASLLACLLVYTGIAMSWRRWQKSRKSVEY